MATLRDRIQEDMKAAMRARESERLGTIRMLLAAIKQREVDERRELPDSEILGVVEKMVKQRKESARQFLEGSRPDLAEKEENEIRILQDYLPAAMTGGEIDAAIDSAIAGIGASGPGDLGKVLGLLRGPLQGRADMAQVAEKVRARLRS